MLEEHVLRASHPRQLPTSGATRGGAAIPGTEGHGCWRGVFECGVWSGWMLWGVEMNVVCWWSEVAECCLMYLNVVIQFPAEKNTISECRLRDVDGCPSMLEMD